MVARPGSTQHGHKSVVARQTPGFEIVFFVENRSELADFKLLGVASNRDRH